jgi:hypothetical protein
VRGVLLDYAHEVAATRRGVAATLDRIKVLVSTLGWQAPKGLTSYPVTQDANTTWNGALGAARLMEAGWDSCHDSAVPDLFRELYALAHTVQRNDCSCG